jgi:hypothetical protein
LPSSSSISSASGMLITYSVIDPSFLPGSADEAAMISPFDLSLGLPVLRLS